MVRRAGKNSRDGIEYSMAQWYPKMCEYDSEGWNADPYTGREFHGVWGSFDVKIKIDKEYTVAASGYLQNADEIGKGYSKRKTPKAKKGKLNGTLLRLTFMISLGLQTKIMFMIHILVLMMWFFIFFTKMTLK